MVGADVGGTFTDVVGWDGTELSVAKPLSTPDRSQGVAAGVVAVVAGRRVPRLIHGTTVATNALLERTGALVALLTDPGFEDLVEIGRQDRPSLYDPMVDRSEVLVERRLRLTDPASVEAARPEAVAISFLNSYQDPSREQAMAKILVGRGMAVTCSHVVAPEFREFERASTTILTAYLRPVVEMYLARLAVALVPDPVERLLVMSSSGGLLTPESAATHAAAILLSGPAGGVVAAAGLAGLLGLGRVVSFDMGGTSTDVCRIDNARPSVGYQRTIDGQICRTPSVAIHTVGAGGGSLGWIDPGGALRVGPRSAGSDPGPACYPNGGAEPTVTDADLYLGRVGGWLAGSIELSPTAAERALARLGDRLGMDPVTVAGGLVEIVEAHMERAVRAVSVEEGVDPGDAWLVAFGGAGGLHATALARRLGMAGVLVPPYAGVFSALGLLLAPPRIDRARTILTEPDDRLDRSVGELAARAADELVAETGERAVALETIVDLRYRGQAHETPVAYRAGEGRAALEARFHTAHTERNGFARPGDPVEVVTIRAAAHGHPGLSWNDLPEPRPTGHPRRPDRRVIVGGVEADAAVWWRPGLAEGQRVVGPAVIEETEATTYLASGERATVHPTGALEIEW